MRASLYVEDQDNCNMAISNMKAAKTALEAAKKTYDDAYTDVQISICRLLEYNGSMNTFELEANTGLDATTIRSLIGPRPRLCSDSRQINSNDGAISGVIIRGKEKVTNKYALINEDGTVDISRTIKKTFIVNHYTFSYK